MSVLQCYATVRKLTKWLISIASSDRDRNVDIEITLHRRGRRSLPAAALAIYIARSIANRSSSNLNLIRRCDRGPDDTVPQRRELLKLAGH